MIPVLKARKIFKGANLSLERLENGPVKNPAEWQVAIPRKRLRLAVQRNRWRRRITETLRRHKGALVSGSRMKWTVERPAELVAFKKLEEEVLNLLERAGILKASQ